MSKFKAGDKVVFLGKYPEMFDDDYVVGKVYIVESHDVPSPHITWPVSERSGDLRLVDEDNLDLAYMRADNFELAPNENDSQVGTGKLRVTLAEFTDRKGSTITIKRSACRHYYMKKPGQPQVRIHKKQLSGILTGLAAAL